MDSAPVAAAAPEPRGWLTALGAVVSLLALAAVLWWASRQEAPTLPTSGPRLLALAAAVLLYFAACAVRGERWLALLRHNGAVPRRADAYALVAVGYMGNNVLPARAGDALRVFFLAPRAHTGARTVIGTLLAERLLDVAVLAVAFILLASIAVGGAGLPSGERLVALAGLMAALAAATAAVALVLHRRDRLVAVWAALAPMAAATRRLRGRHGAAMLAVTLAVWGLEAGVWWTCGEAAGLDLDAVEAGYLLSLASMFALVPSGPGYAGTMDAAVIFGARVLGRGASATLSYLLLLRFVLFVPITLAGLGVLVLRYGGLARLRAARAHTAA